MSVEFRQRTPGEYAQIIWNRKWLIILPTIAIATAIAWVVYRLPDVYESTTLIVVKPATISTAVINPTLSEDTLTRQLMNISQVVTSRSSLQPLVEKYGLYQAELSRGEPMESVVDRMRSNIRVEVNTSRNDITNGFNITFRGRDPRSTQAVTAELASKYINAQTEATRNSSASTKQFFEQQLVEAEARLKEIDDRRLQFMQQNVAHLPSESQALIGRLAGLREEQKARIAEVGRLRDLIAAYNSQLGDIQKQSAQEIEDVTENYSDPKSTLAYAQLAQRKAQLEAEYQNMLTTLKPKNPDVIAKKAELDAVQREMDQMVSEGNNKVEERRRRLLKRVDPRLFTMRTNLQLVQGDLERQQRLLDQTNSQIANIEQRINNVPATTVELERLNRDYQTQKINYDQLMQQQQKAALAADVATNAQGEGIQVIDPANLPQRPVAPKRQMLMALGLAFGLAVGLAFAAFFEVPRLLTIQTTEDAKHYTGLPVLASVPELLTPQEIQRIPYRRMLLLAAGIVATIISIPVLALALRLAHVFDRFVS
ncbi:MAG TPA: GNVR domain-containing protein [Pyrinomonadaceae bacterium]|nr:GNVR domain-containing protein [Pyrinomonadaceae bacterium]